MLSLGTTFRYKKKFDPGFKKVVIEVLYRPIPRLADQDLVTVNENSKPQLLAESTKVRDLIFGQAITKKLKNAATNLKQYDEVTVRKADKSTCFVIMKKTNNQ